MTTGGPGNGQEFLRPLDGDFKGDLTGGRYRAQVTRTARDRCGRTCARAPTRQLVLIERRPVFQPTQAPIRATDFCFTRAGSALGDAADSFLESGPSTMSSTLGSSLLSDLRRFAHEPGGAELLAVLAVVAAGVSVLPREQLFHCTVDLCELPVEALGGELLPEVAGPAKYRLAPT